MIGKQTIVVVSVLTGAALELIIDAVSGRREAWDSGLYWTIGVPTALLISASLGFLSRGRDGIWTLVIIPSQVMTKMMRSGEIGGLWPPTVALSALLSAPFVGAALVGAKLRSTTSRAGIQPERYAP